MRAEAIRAGALVRAEAARIDALIVREGITAEVALAASTAVPEHDRPLLHALVYEALRWHHRLQWQIGELATLRAERTDAELTALLRVGLAQLQGMRVPPHAAVSATVDASRVLGLGRARGLVNAVLRRFLREREALCARGERDDQARLSHPAWLIEAVRADWPDAAPAIFAANNAPPPMWLRVNARVSSAAQYLERLQAHGLEGALSARAPAAILLAEPRPMRSLPGYEAGEVSVQDAAAQLAARFLQLRPGLRVLDACAAPGGKTAHMLESCDGLSVVALDRDAERLASLRANLARLGLGAEILEGDARAPESWWDGRPFDRILLDAPCSALGVIRRHPEIKLLRTPGEVEAAAAQQAELLERLWPLLTAGGKLLYATCTLLTRENLGPVERFLAVTPEAALTGPGSRGLQVLPGEANMDGFYYACLEKRSQQ